MTFLFIGFLLFIVIAIALNQRMSDEDKVRAYIEEQGGEFISLSRNWMKEPYAGGGYRFYDCNYRDAGGVSQDQLLKVGWGEIKVVK